jgi:hypothetical protein
MLRIVDSFERQLKDIKLDIKTCQKEAKSIAQQVKAGNIASVVTTAASVVSGIIGGGAAFITASNEDFCTEVLRDGSSFMETPEGQVAMAIAFGGLGLALGLGWISNKIKNKTEDNQELLGEYNEYIAQRKEDAQEVQGKIDYINNYEAEQAAQQAAAARQAYKDNFWENYERISAGIEADASAPKTEDYNFDLITDHFKKQPTAPTDPTVGLDK